METRQQEYVKAEILHLASIIKADREAVKRILAASVASTRLQIQTSAEVVHGIKHRYETTRTLLHKQYGYQLISSKFESPGAPMSGVLQPKPSKVKVQNLLIRPEHLARLPNPHPQPQNQHLYQNQNQNQNQNQQRQASRHRKNELVSVWEGSEYKRALTASLSLKLLHKLCFSAIRHNALTRSIARQSACTADLRRRRVLLLLCFRSLLFEARSTRYIDLICAGRVRRLQKSKLFQPALDTWGGFARFSLNCKSLIALGCASIERRQRVQGMVLLAWNREQSRRRRLGLAWAYRRCRALRQATALYAWVLAFAKTAHLRRILETRSQRERNFSRLQQTFLLYRGKKQYRYTNVDLSAIEKPDALQRGFREDLGEADEALAALRADCMLKVLAFARVPVWLDVDVGGSGFRTLGTKRRNQPSFTAISTPSRADLNSLAALAAMHPPYALSPAQAGLGHAFKFNSLALSQIQSQYHSQSQESPMQASYSSNYNSGGAEEGQEFLSTANLFLSSTLQASSPPGKLHRSPLQRRQHQQNDSTGNYASLRFSTPGQHPAHGSNSTGGPASPDSLLSKGTARSRHRGRDWGSGSSSSSSPSRLAASATHLDLPAHMSFFERVYAMVGAELVEARLSELSAMGQGLGVGIPRLSGLLASLMPERSGPEHVEDDESPHPVYYTSPSKAGDGDGGRPRKGVPAGAFTSPSLAHLELSARLVRRCRWALHRLRSTANMHVSHRLLKRQTQTGVLLRAVVALKRAAAKVATTFTLCDSIARVAAQRRALGKLVRLFVTGPKLLVRRVSSLRRRALVFRVLKGWRKIYWSNVAERQLVKMTRRERLGCSIEAWKQAFNQRRRTRGLRMRVFRRELTPLFKAWHVKAHRAGLLRRVFSLREAAWQFRYLHTIHQSTFTRLHSTFIAWASYTHIRIGLRKERNDEAKALRFRLVTLLGSPFFAWSDWTRRLRRAAALRARLQQKWMRLIISRWRACAKDFREALARAQAARRLNSLHLSMQCWQVAHQQLTVEAPRRHANRTLQLRAILQWRFARRLRCLREEVIPRAGKVCLARHWQQWRRTHGLKLRLGLGLLLLGRCKELHLLRRTLSLWPGRSEWRKAEAMRRHVLSKGPGRVELVDNDGGQLTVLKRLSRREELAAMEAETKVKAEAAAYRSFLERSSAPVEQRAAIFGMIFSADDHVAVQRLLSTLRAVLFAWCDIARTTRILRGVGRLVQFKHRVRELERSIRWWMQRTPRTAHRQAQWIAKASVRPHADYVRRQEVERRALEGRYAEAAGPWDPRQGTLDDLLDDDDAAAMLALTQSEWSLTGVKGTRTMLSEMTALSAARVSLVVSASNVRGVLKQKEREALARSVVNRMLGR